MRQFRAALATLRAIRIFPGTGWVSTELVAVESELGAPVDERHLHELVARGIIQSQAFDGEVWLERRSLRAARALLLAVLLVLVALLGLALASTASCDWLVDSGLCPKGLFS